MIICKKCKKAVSYNSYFQKYICSCGWECIENDTKTDIEEDIKILKENLHTLNRHISNYEKSNCKTAVYEELVKEANAIENILADRERLEKENKNLNFILKAGLSKEKQYCFNEDGSTGKCLGYGTFNDDEPCDYCKSCKRINIKEDD